MFRLAVPLVLLLVLAAILRVQEHRTGKTHTFSWLPKGGSDAILQLGLFVLADVMYETVRGVAESNAATAFANARSIVDLEQGTGLFVERSVQAWAMGHRFIIDFANFMYVNSHFVLTTGALVWLYLRHNDHFYFVRNMFMVGMALALVGYLVMPTAPPRFLPELGFVDTIAYYVERAARLRAGGPVLQPLRGRPEHARRLLADDRRAGDADRAPPGLQGAVGASTRCWSASS